MPHPDIFEEREPLGKWLAGSVILHISIAAALLAHTFLPGNRILMGDPHGGGFGAVAVSPVATIPLPSRSGPVNPVANDTQSHIPTPPPAKKAQPKVKAPDPDAIPIGKDARHRPTPMETAPPNKFREKQTYAPNQVYSNVGQAAVSPMIGRQGAGGVGIGTNSPFGTQFGYYANIIQQKVSQNWKTTDLDPHITSAPSVTITFTIERDGSVPQSSVRVIQRSGILPLDFSAQRAILDSAPFPPLPQGFQRSSADVQLQFELRR